MKKIPLIEGKFAIVDDADFDWLNQWKWWLARSRTDGIEYAIRQEHLPGNYRARKRPYKRNIWMHKLLLPEARRVDHKDGCGLHNWRSNLRAASCGQNAANSNIRKNNTSGFKGVSWSKARQKWIAYIDSSGRRHLGYFISAEEAARAYDKAAIELFGEFARLNFPLENKNNKQKEMKQ